jgi:hypothetical protein
MNCNWRNDLVENREYVIEWVLEMRLSGEHSSWITECDRHSNLSRVGEWFTNNKNVDLNRGDPDYVPDEGLIEWVSEWDTTYGLDNCTIEWVWDI